MNNSHSRHTGAHLDPILDGWPTRDPLGNLVAVLRAPAQPHEIVGLDAALNAGFVETSATSRGCASHAVHSPTRDGDGAAAARGLCRMAG